MILPSMKGHMLNAQALVVRMSEVEKIKIRSATEAGLISLYYDFQAELSGGHLKGGTVEEGIREMQEVSATLSADFNAKSASSEFGNTWKF